MSTIPPRSVGKEITEDLLVEILGAEGGRGSYRLYLGPLAPKFTIYVSPASVGSERSEASPGGKPLYRISSDDAPYNWIPFSTFGDLVGKVYDLGKARGREEKALEIRGFLRDLLGLKDEEG
jgi:hypothetical protein